MNYQQNHTKNLAKFNNIKSFISTFAFKFEICNFDIFQTILDKMFGTLH